jgi:hypothetical protein
VSTGLVCPTTTTAVGAWQTRRSHEPAACHDASRAHSGCMANLQSPARMVPLASEPISFGCRGCFVPEWFRRFGDIPGVFYTSPEQIDRSFLADGGDVPEVHTFGFDGQLQETLWWPAGDGSRGGSASPAHYLARHVARCGSGRRDMAAIPRNVVSRQRRPSVPVAAGKSDRRLVHRQRGPARVRAQVATSFCSQSIRCQAS